MYGEDSICLYFDPDNNFFVDEGGFIVFNIFEYITPNDLYVFRRKSEDLAVKHRSLPGVACELFWPEKQYYFDIGDDYERVTRYERGVNHWHTRMLYNV